MPSTWTVPSLPRPPRDVKKKFVAVPVIDWVEFTSRVNDWTPGTIARTLPYVRVAGTSASTEPGSTTSRLVLVWTSTTGVTPVTVTVSATEPTRMSALIVVTPAPVSSIASRLMVANPDSVNVTLKVPGSRSTIRYWPVLSVTTSRDFSMSAGLDASTLTPGMTAPDASLTMPARAGWENAGMENSSSNARTTDPIAKARIVASNLAHSVRRT